jgi:hypothetical protein
MKKGVQIKSYLISHGLIRAGFKMWKQIDLYFHHKYSLGSHILYWKCVNLYLLKVKQNLITILSPAQSTLRCVKTASTRCVFKIYSDRTFRSKVGLKVKLLLAGTSFSILGALDFYADPHPRTKFLAHPKF